MASGIQAKEECATAFVELKFGKLKYITFKLTDDLKEIEVSKKLEVVKDVSLDNKETYQEFVEEIKGSGDPQCRFGVFDFEFNAGEGLRKKVCFFSWTPDGAKIKQKMVYASSRDSLVKSFNGVQVAVQATDDSEIDYDTILEKCTRSGR